MNQTSQLDQSTRETGNIGYSKPALDSLIRRHVQTGLLDRRIEPKPFPIQVLDLGCGTFPYQAQDGEIVTHVDCRTDIKPDVVHDLAQYPYPFSDDSFDKIYASHVLEHLPDNIRFMEEIYRIGKPGGTAIIRVPHFSGRSAWCDPTHLRAYSYYQFTYYSPNSRDRYGNCNYVIEKVQLHYIRFPNNVAAKALNGFFNFFANLNVNICEKLWCYWVGGFSEIYVGLRIVKNSVVV